jgi:hypothetical protein
MAQKEGTTIAWILRAATGAGIAFLIPLLWYVSQQIEVQNAQIERNTRMIERLIDAIFKDYYPGKKAPSIPRE